MSLSTLNVSLIDFGNYLIEFCKKRNLLWTEGKSFRRFISALWKDKACMVIFHLCWAKCWWWNSMVVWELARVSKPPKMLVNIRNENTFLDLAVKQIEHLNKTYDTDVHLVSMTSFNMDRDTKKSRSILHSMQSLLWEILFCLFVCFSFLFFLFIY